jgi:AcrR family transcriptional regulator
MMNTRIDRRTARTREALMSAFAKLMLTRGYESVGIGDIVREANVGRSTFYLHYPNKEALLEESLKHPSSGLAACVGGDVTAAALTPLLEHFREQRKINRVFLEYPIRRLWVKSLAALIEPKLTNIARSSRVQPLIPRVLLALTLAEMQIALITHWLECAARVKSEMVAAALIINTRAILAGGMRSSAH